MIITFCEAALLFTCLMSGLLSVLILPVYFNRQCTSFSSRWITLTAHCPQPVPGISFCLTVSVRKLCGSSLTELPLGQGTGCCISSGEILSCLPPQAEEPLPESTLGEQNTDGLCWTSVPHLISGTTSSPILRFKHKVLIYSQLIVLYGYFLPVVANSTCFCRSLGSVNYWCFFVCFCCRVHIASVR